MTARTLALTPVLLIVGALQPTLLAAESQARLTAEAQQAFERGDLRGGVSALERLRFQRALTDEQHLELAQTYLRLGRLEEAKSEAARVDPGKGGTELLMLRGALARREEDWSQARDLYTEVTERDPSHAEAYLSLGQALGNLGDEPAADAAFAIYDKLTR